MSNSRIPRSVSKEEDLITVETHGHYQKQTTTSYMSHNVKENVSLCWGGGGPGSFNYHTA